jgi:hypothetical protein
MAGIMVAVITVTAVATVAILTITAIITYLTVEMNGRAICRQNGITVLADRVAQEETHTHLVQARELAEHQQQDREGLVQPQIHSRL